MDALGRPIYEGDIVAYIGKYGRRTEINKRKVEGVKPPVGDKPHMLKLNGLTGHTVRAYNCVNLSCPAGDI